MVSVPYSSFSALLTKRQPMVVSSILALREGAIGLAHDVGARVIDSTPPAIIRLASPA
jgi:hypothetical protein